MRVASVRFLVAAALGLAAASLVVAPMRAAAIGGGVGFGINLVRLVGALDVEHSPTEIMGSTLLIGDKKIPFSIQSAERISGAPEDGVGVLLPIGNSHPTLRLIGEPSFLHPIAAAPAGTVLTLIGNLNTSNSYIEVMGADLPPSAGAE